MRWLHLSDLNFGDSSAGLESIREKIMELATRMDPVNTLFVTGNLVAGNKSLIRDFQPVFRGYFDEAVKYLNSLQGKFNISKERTFLAPGVHDRYLNQVLKPAVKNAQETYSSEDGAVDEEILTAVREAEADFARAYKEICGREYPEEHYTLTMEDFRIHCLHTDILSVGENSADGRNDGNPYCGRETGLIVGRRLLNRLNGEKQDFSIGPDKPVKFSGITLAHHDFDCLYGPESAALEGKLTDLDAALYLCGGASRAFRKIQNSINEKKRIWVFGCGISTPQGGRSEASLLVGEINHARSSGYVEAYKWSSRVQAWLTDNEFSYRYDDCATDGRVYFPKRPFDRVSNPTTMWNRYLRYLKVRCDNAEPDVSIPFGHTMRQTIPLAKVFVPPSLYVTSFSDEMNLLKLQGTGFERGGKRDKTPKGEPKEIKELSKAIPRYEIIRVCVLSDTGGGKSTLINWTASAYGYAMTDGIRETGLPILTLYPIWIRCREIPHGALQSPFGRLEEVFEWLARCVGTEKRPVSENDVKDFCGFLREKADEGTAFLLIDGLDEIHEQTEQQNFVQQLSNYIEAHSRVNVLMTTRFSGLNALVQDSAESENERSNENSWNLIPAFHDFQWFQIAPMDEDRIRSFCERRLAFFHNHNLLQSSDIGRLLDSREVRTMAENPMLLTLILLAWQRTGRLPERKTILFRDALNTLMDQWKEMEPGFDADEMVSLLSAIAFSMMADKASKIEEGDLRGLIENLLKNRTDLFFKLRSSEKALVFLQSGPIFHICGSKGIGETLYEFRQSYLQVYLAALAVVTNCYTAYSDVLSALERVEDEEKGIETKEDRPGNVLLSYMDREHEAMTNVFVLTAMMSQPCACLIYKSLLAGMEQSRRDSEQYRYLRHLLLCLPAEGVPLTDYAVERILARCFQERIQKKDVIDPVLVYILNGRYRSFMRNRFCKMGGERFSRSEQEDYANYWDAMEELLTGQHEPAVYPGALTPLRYYLANQDNPDAEKRSHAVALFSAALWLPSFRLNGCQIHPSQEFEELNEKDRTADREQIRGSLLRLWDDKEPCVQMQFLRLLGQRSKLERLGFLNQSDYPLYLRSYLRFMNERAQTPPMLHLNHIVKIMIALCNGYRENHQRETFCLSESALDTIITGLEENTQGGEALNMKLLSVSLLASACNAPVRLQCRLFDLIRRERRSTWKTFPDEESMENNTLRYRKALTRMMQSGWICSEEERHTVWRCIQEMNLDIAAHMSRHGDPDNVHFENYMKKLKDTELYETIPPYSANTLSGIMKEIQARLDADSAGTMKRDIEEGS